MPDSRRCPTRDATRPATLAHSEPGARLVLVARREERLRALAEELAGATVVACDLTEDHAPAQVRDVVVSDHGELHLLVTTPARPGAVGLPRPAGRTSSGI